MEKSFTQKIDTLTHQLRNLQHNGNTRKWAETVISTEKLIEYAEELKATDKAFNHQNEELLFAYQTLVVGYQRYWELFNFAPDGYLVTDSTGVIQEANQTVLVMLSTTRTELLGKPIYDFIPEIKARDFGMQLNWLRGSQILEVNLRPQNCTPFFASLSVSPQCNTENKTVGLLWLIRDISERKKMEEALQKSKNELGLILEQTPCILWTTDTQLKLTSITGAALSTLKSSHTDIIGVKITDYFESETSSIFLTALENALNGHPQTFELERNGQIFQCTVEAFINTSKQISGVIGAAFEITDRKKAERILEQSERFNASLLQNSPNPILVIDGDTSISYINPAFEKLTGFSAQVIIDQKAPYPWWPAEHRAESGDTFQKSLKKNKDKQEKLFHKKNGDPFWVEETIIPVGNGNTTEFHLQTWVDITEAKKLREDLEFYVKQITKVQEEERKRISQELHEETVQSLSALCLATEAIIKSKDRCPQDSLRYLEELRGKISEVIDQVRRFSYALRPGVLDYLGLLAALETLTDELNQEGFKTSLEVFGIEKPLPPDMEIDLFRITQEALSNVKKFSLADKVNVTVSYLNGKVKLNITDDGQGFILPERLSDLVNQGKLGLFGIEERTRLLGGSFSIHARPQNGTKIIVTLPVPN